MEIIPTIVPESVDQLQEHAAALARFANRLHIDAADGRFAPNTTWMPSLGEALPDAMRVGYEAHLMVLDPRTTGVAYARAGAHRIIGHIESFTGPEEAAQAFDAWRAAGAYEVGVAILLDTSLEELEPYLSLTSHVLLMTIAQIGAQGQSFDPIGIERVAALHARHPELTITVDGGINETNILEAARAGATCFCVGAALATSPEPEAVYRRLVEMLEGIQ